LGSSAIRNVCIKAQMIRIEAEELIIGVKLRSLSD